MRRKTIWILLLILTAWLLQHNWNSGPPSHRPVAPASKSVPAAAPSQISAAPEAEPPSAQMDPDDEIRAALQRIESGKKLYSKDGTVFQNREGRLPDEPEGYYHEYTVETPGSSDRGARRIIRGNNGETYYTSDHYRTFVRIDKAENTQ